MLKAKKLLQVFIVSLAIFFLPATIIAQGEKLEPDLREGMITKVVVQIIEKAHYNTPTLDDDVSKRLFKEYFNRIDPNHHFFLEKDIKSFEINADILDNMLTRGNIEFPFKVHKVYLKRIKERVDYVEKRLKSPFDFAKKETMLIDRKDEPWPKSEKELNEIWRKSIKNQLLLAKLADIKSKEEGKKKDKKKEAEADPKKRIVERYQHLYKFISNYDSDDIVEMYLSTFTELFDPHSSYLNWRTSEDFDIALKLSLQGIGALLTSDNGYPKIVRIIPGGAADKQGELKAGYFITGVGEGTDTPKSVIDMPLHKIVRKIRGKKGTKVTLKVQKDLKGVPFDIVITRDKIELKERAAQSEVKKIVLPDKTKTNIGIIYLPSFYRDFTGFRNHKNGARSTTQDVKRLIDKMIKKSDIKGLIIDLRYNPGGSLIEAIDLAGLFIPKGTILKVKSRRGHLLYNDHDNGFFYKMPLLVMINAFSASASEIFAGAIKDYERGILVGQATYGKGTVQHLLELSRFIPLKKTGAIKYTHAKFYRVTGSSTQKKGVHPDIVYPAFTTQKDYGEGSQKNAMEWDQVEKAKYEKCNFNLDKIFPVLIKKHNKRIANSELFKELKKYIKWWNAHKDKKTVSLNMKIRRKESEEQDKLYKIVEKVWKKNAQNTMVDPKLEKNLKGDKLKEKGPDKKDLYLDETLNILKDYLQLQNS